MANFIQRFAIAIVVFAGFLVLFSLFYSYKNLGFDTNQDHLISEDLEYFQNYQSFLKEFGDWESIVVVAKASRPKHEQVKSFSKRLVEKLNQSSGLFDHVKNKIDQEQFFQNAFLFLEAGDLENLRSQRDLIQKFLAVRHLDDWYHVLNDVLKQKNAKASRKEMKASLKFLTTAALAPFDQRYLEKWHWQNLLNSFSDDFVDPDGFVFSKDGRYHVIEVFPQKNYSQMEIINEPLNFLRETVSELKKDYPKLKVGITGRPVLQNDEATSTAQDSEFYGLLAFILVTLLFLSFIRGNRVVLANLLSLACAISLTLGVVTFLYGAVNLLTVAFAIILIGLGIDYGIHFLIPFLQKQQASKDRVAVLKEITAETSPAIFIGALTSALAFSSAYFTDFQGLRELGVVVSSGLILSCLAQIILFPALLHIMPRSWSQISFRLNWFSKVPQKLHLRPKEGFLVYLLILLFGFFTIFQIQFDHNLLALQDPELESVVWEREISHHPDLSTWFLVYQTKNEADLLKKTSELQKLKTVAKTASVFDFLPQNVDKKIPLLMNLQSESATELRSSSESLKIFLKTLTQKSQQAFSQGLLSEFETLTEIKNRIESIKTPKFEKSFLNQTNEIQSFFRMNLRPEGLSLEDLPSDLKTHFLSPNGTYALWIYPKTNIWNWKHLGEFIHEVRQIAPTVTGAPITTYETAKLMQDGFVKVGWITLLVVFTILLFYFRSLALSFLVITNLCLTLIVLGSVMVVSGTSINLANFFALPVLIGSGVDHAVHIIQKWRQGSIQNLYEMTVPAVILSCLTTMCSFGMLSLVRHQGLASFGYLMLIGTALILFMSVWVLPAVLRHPRYQKLITDNE